VRGSDKVIADELETFRDIRDAYLQKRVAERRAIVQRLREAGYEVSTNVRAGRGLSNYTSGGKLNPPHDLSHWMWVDAVRSDGVKVRVLLQSFDRDAQSKNEHVLLDRLSIGVIPAHIEHSRWLIDAGLELPLDAAMLEQLVGMVNSL